MARGKCPVIVDIGLAEALFNSIGSAFGRYFFNSLNSDELIKCSFKTFLWESSEFLDFVSGVSTIDNDCFDNTPFPSPKIYRFFLTHILSPFPRLTLSSWVFIMKCIKKDCDVPIDYASV